MPEATRIDTPTQFKPVTLSITLTSADEVRALITAHNKLAACELGDSWNSDIREEWVSILSTLGGELYQSDATLTPKIT